MKKVLVAFFILAAVFVLIFTNNQNTATVTTNQSTGISQKPVVDINFGQRALHFEPNIGQTDGAIKFVSQAENFTLFLSPNETILSLKNFQTSDDILAHLMSDDKDSTEIMLGRSSSIIKMQLAGAHQNPIVSGEKKQAGKSNYIIGKDPEKWHTNVENYARVRYEKVYDGIDLVYYGNQQQIEYDFIVSPHTDPDVISIDFEGTEDIKIDQQGDLVLDTESGKLVVQKPIVFQQYSDSAQYIAGNFILKNDNHIGFDLGDYDESLPLVIDPKIVFSTRMGGRSGTAAGKGIAVDDSGHIYILGMVINPNFPVTDNAFETEYHEGDNQNCEYSMPTVTKMNSEGTELIYSTYIGGSDWDDIGFDIAVDRTGDAYITGIAWSADYPTTSGAYLSTNLDYTGGWWDYGDVFVTKLNHDGSDLVYSTFLGTQTRDYGAGIAVDDFGHAYVTGLAGRADTHFPTTAGSYMPDLSGNHQDGFITKLAPDGGSLVFSTYIDVNYWGYCTDIAIDDFGNSYVTGNGPVALKLNNSGTEVLFRTEMDNSIQGNGIVLDKENNSYVIGTTNDGAAFFTSTPNAYQPNNGGFYDAYVAKIDSNGTIVYTTFLGGSHYDYGHGIGIDDSGFVHIGGLTTSKNFPTKDAVQDTFGGIWDYFVAKMDLSQSGESSLLYSTYLGGSGYDFIPTHVHESGIPEVATRCGVTADAMGNTYITGHTSSRPFPVTEGVFSEIIGQMFITKIGFGSDLVRAAEIWEIIPFDGPFEIVKNRHKAIFHRQADGTTIEAEGDVVRVQADSIWLKVPEELLGERKGVHTPPPERQRVAVDVEIIVNRVGAPPDTVWREFDLILPHHFIYDMVEVPPAKVPQHILPQYGLRDSLDTETFVFVGRGSDGMAAIRAINTIPGVDFPPLHLKATLISPYGEEPPANSFHIGTSNEGEQYNVSHDGLYIIVVETHEAYHKDDLFPNPFQIHLAGNVGLPRKLLADGPEFPRGLRQDILFNSVAPRPQTLDGRESVFDFTFFDAHHEVTEQDTFNVGQTALFKFANPVQISPYANAVLVPPQQWHNGLPLGTPYVRALDPIHPLNITVPTARTRMVTDLGPVGTVVDFTQIPDPAPPEGNMDSMTGTVGAVLGKVDGITLEYPNSAGFKSLILDKGSGMEIVDGPGHDFTIFAEGTYTVAVSNTPFFGTFIQIGGTNSGEQSFDLAGTPLSSCRYVLVSASNSVTLDGIKAINMFYDDKTTEIGPVADAKKATITMRRLKGPETSIDPFMELIGPDGLWIAENESGYGDGTSLDLSDAAIINAGLSRTGFYRFLGRGYHLRPEPNDQIYGDFLVHLETAGNYDPDDIVVSSKNEDLTVAQKTGEISTVRQRNSYVFQANPGDRIGVSVKKTSGNLNPVVELYGPEDHLIAANDDYKSRGRNSVLVVNNLPAISFVGHDPLINPTTYRIVVTSIDSAGADEIYGEGKIFKRIVNPGTYELKVFTGDLSGEEIPAPIVTRVQPTKAVPGATGLDLSISGKNFEENSTLTFSGDGITVTELFFMNSTYLKAKVDISKSAPLGYRSVFVTSPNGKIGQGLDLFHIKESMGQVHLSWKAPVNYLALAAPENLQAQYGGGLLSFNKQKDISRLVETINEIEPNNDVTTAQMLNGPTPIVVKGTAETSDDGSVILRGPRGSDADDFEDLYIVTTSDTGLAIRLDGFTSDCDLRLARLNTFNASLDWSVNVGPTSPEDILCTTCPPDSYLVGVSIYDPAPQGANTTAYTLTLLAQFEGNETNWNSYYIYRSNMPDPINTGVLIDSIDATSTSYTDEPLNNGYFYYQVTAVYPEGESQPSNETIVVVTKTDFSIEPNSPTEFLVYQNYPNPFNPTTTIEYTLPNSGQVQIDIFDMLGRHIRKLADFNQPPGQFKVLWDATNDLYIPVAGGIYLCRIKAGEYTKVIKLALVR